MPSGLVVSASGDGCPKPAVSPIVTSQNVGIQVKIRPLMLHAHGWNIWNQKRLHATVDLITDEEFLCSAKQVVTRSEAET